MSLLSRNMGIRSGISRPYRQQLVLGTRTSSFARVYRRIWWMSRSLLIQRWAIWTLHIAKKLLIIDVSDIRDYVKSLSGYPPIFSFTISWRALVGLPSFNTLTSLRLPKTVLKLKMVRALKGVTATYMEHTRTLGVKVSSSAVK